MSAQVVYRFNGFRLDPVRRLLFGADGQPIPLKPKVFATLLYLVERPGELVDKEALLEAVWPHVVVEENNLNKAISTLRQVFGETRDEHRFIVTEPGRGYRFVASVEAVPAASGGAATRAALRPLSPHANAAPRSTARLSRECDETSVTKRPRLTLAVAGHRGGVRSGRGRRLLARTRADGIRRQRRASACPRTRSPSCRSAI